jgi:xanthine dehydrogenase accessory factor
MIDILHDLENWINEHERIALATVVSTWGSSPRGVGAKMAITPRGRVTGSVSGGCVEGAVFEAGVRVLKTGHPELLHFGVADELAWDVGLACGGKIDIFVQPLDNQMVAQAASSIRSRTPVALVTVIGGKTEMLGRQLLFSEKDLLLDAGEGVFHAAREAANAGFIAEKPQRLFFPVDTGEQVEFFVELFLPSPVLVIVGGVHTAIYLAKLAKDLGFWTVLLDPRKAFGNSERFPEVSQLIQSWPQEAFEQIPPSKITCFAILTHDPKIDDPAIKLAFKSDASYIGALGSRTTHEKRCQRLFEAGVSKEQIQRIHSPIGLPIQAKTPEEVALSVMAEIISEFRKSEQI